MTTLGSGRRAGRMLGTMAALAMVGAMTLASGAPARAALVATGVPDNYTATHDRMLSVAAPGVLGNDLNLLGGTTAVLVSDVTHGLLDLRSSGRFTYQPDPGYVGADTFRYRPSGLLSTAATVRIDVTNAVPVAFHDSYTWGGGTLTVSAPGVLTNDSDADGDALTAELVGGGVSGSLDLDPAGGFQLHPGGGFGSSGMFKYRVSDGIRWSSPVTVSLTIVVATPKPTPSPTPKPTPRPTPAPTPRPLPSLPLPSLPLPSLPLLPTPQPSGLGPLPTPRPTPSPSEPAAQPTARPTTQPPTSPAASPSPDPASPLPGGIPPPGGPRGGDDPDAQPQPALRLPSRDGIDLGLGDLGTIGGFDTWAVPAATVGGAGLLVLLFVGLQAGATVVWVPAVRRLRGERRPRRRRRR
jgi:hypothetical protein